MTPIDSLGRNVEAVTEIKLMVDVPDHLPQVLIIFNQYTVGVVHSVGIKFSDLAANAD